MTNSEELPEKNQEEFSVKNFLSTKENTENLFYNKFKNEDLSKVSLISLFNELNHLIKNNFDLNCFSAIEKKFNTTSLIVNLISQNNSGITLALKKICDIYGFYFIKKNLEKFSSINEIIKYFKKIQFSKVKIPKIYLLKNCENLFKLIKPEEKLELIYFKKELYEILNYENSNIFNRSLFVFHFKKQSDIPQEFKDLFQYSFVNYAPNTSVREFYIKNSLNNKLFNLFVVNKIKCGNKIKLKIKDNFLKEVFNKLIEKKNLSEISNNLDTEFPERENDTLNNYEIDLLKNEDIYLLNFYHVFFSCVDIKEIARLIIGFDLKEIKYFIDEIFEKLKYLIDTNENSLKILSNDNNYLSFTIEMNQYIKEKLSDFRKLRCKVEKTISAIPEVKWSDVGGLENAKEDIYDTIQLPLKFPKLFNNNLKRRSGLLLYGPPGSGKTLLAKAIANECSMNFISIKGPELLNMYVGESEKNIREVFERGRENKPCVLFFDEIDALAPARTKNTDQSNVMDRIVAQFMTEMDGILKGNDLIIIASTNRPDLVDPSLLRPGRFDKMIYVGFPKSKEEKKKILIAQTKKFSLFEDVNFDELAEICPEDYSGADIYAVCSSAFTFALKDFLLIENGNKKNEENVLFYVKKIDFINSINKISPSISKEELNKYEELKKKYS